MFKWLSRTILFVTVTTGFSLAQQTPKKQFVFAFFANGVVSGVGFDFLGLRTDFVLTNPGLNIAQVKFQFFARDGSELRISLQRERSNISNPLELTGQSSMQLATNPESTLSVCWIVVESTEFITALENISWVDMYNSPTAVQSSIRTLSNVVISPSIAVRGFKTSITDSVEWGSGLCLVSQDSNTVIDGTLTLFDDSGKRLASRVITLPPRTQFLQLGTEIFPELASMRSGTIDGQFSGEVSVTSLRYGKTASILSSILLSANTAQ
jgi:hypothetical protein